ncbi:amidohydrolase [Streptomyces sp. NPDC087851]|uniref:amidohydrolase n=1 Tax=Streptomyces sp. NPDC087851 TaxID=3365810 RepID=UPI003818F79E
MIETASLVDQYCHGVLTTELGLGTFETQLGVGALPAPGTTFFDTQTGVAIRRWCPPLLGLEPHCTPARYLARRRELGTLEVSRRLLRATGISTYLVDTEGAEDTHDIHGTGGPAGPGSPGALTGAAETAATGAAHGREIVRLEPLAARVAATAGGVGAFLAGLAEAVHTAAASAVALSAAATTRPGHALDPEPPGPGEVRGAAGRWLSGRGPGGGAGPGAGLGGDPGGGPLTDPVLLRHLHWTAVGTGLPLHLSARGGTDAYPFAAATAGTGGALVLRDTYPYHRDAACLTGLFPQVYADLGSVLTRTGAGAAGVLAEMLDSAPFGKLLFSTGARGLPELHLVGARVFRVALERVLGGWVRDGAWSVGDARRVAGLIAAGNARRVHGLTDD